MKNARPATGERQAAEICVAHFAAPSEQPHGDEKESIGKKRATSLDTTLQYNTVGAIARQAADLKDGGLRYWLREVLQNTASTHEQEQPRADLAWEKEDGLGRVAQPIVPDGEIQ